MFEKIAAEMARYSDWIDAVCIQRAGEPLLDKKLGSRIQILKEAGIKKITMSTNASLLTQEKSVELLEAGLLQSLDRRDGLVRRRKASEQFRHQRVPAFASWSWK